MPARTILNDEFFDSRVEKIPEAGCWLWMRSVVGMGYGHASVDGQMWLIHRLSYSFYRGAIPDSLFVLHKCDVPCCCNPSHLHLGTHQDNATEKKLRNRARGAPGQNNHRAKITEITALAIRRGNESTDFLMQKHSLSRSAICRIRRKTSWKHLGD